MGINDRDYSRPGIRGGFGGGPGSSGGGIPSGAFRPRGWSVNTWLIAICVAVFVVDQFMPRVLGSIRTLPVVPTAGGFAALPADAEVDDPITPSDWSMQLVSRLPERFLLYRSSGEGQAFQPVPVTRQALMRGQSVRLYRPVGELSSDGQWQPKTGSYSVTDADGKRQTGDYLLFSEVIAAGPIWTFGYFSTAKAIVQFIPGRLWPMGLEVWRFVTFQFLHANLTHLLFNMLGLYFFGSLVEQYLGSKRYLAFYLLCGVAGAAMYLVLNLFGWIGQSMAGLSVPGLLVNDPGTPLVGASAGVFGVLMASAFLVPNATVLLFFVIPMKLATLAYGLVIIAFATVFFGGNNAGGEAAHLGGAIAGFWFIRHPHSLHGFFDFLGRYDPTSRSGAAYRAGKARSRGGSTLDDAEIDRILAKIHDKGLQSLTSKEKRLLREASKR